jgi:hypothetical protein
MLQPHVGRQNLILEILQQKTDRGSVFVASSFYGAEKFIARTVGFSFWAVTKKNKKIPQRDPHEKFHTHNCCVFMFAENKHEPLIQKKLRSIQWRWGRLIKLTNSSRSKSHSRAHPSPSSAPELYYFLFQGFAPRRWTWTNLSWSSVRIKEWVKEKERQGQGKSKRVPRHICIAPFVTCIIHVHARNKNEHGSIYRSARRCSTWRAVIIKIKLPDPIS